MDTIALGLIIIAESGRPPGITELPNLHRVGPLMPIISLSLIFGLLAVLGFILLNQRRKRHQYTTWSAFLYWIMVRIYCPLVHRPTVIGLERIPDTGPVLLVSNHTGSADPFLLIAYVPRLIRWIMARNTDVDWASFFTDAGETIYVNQDGRDVEGTRKAIKALKDGALIGIFPEGGIARPTESIIEFKPGVGLLIRKAKPTVLPVWISGTPKVDNALHALKRFSHARIEIGEPLEFDDATGAKEITQRLRERIREMSGWPFAEEIDGSNADRSTMSDTP